MTDFETKIALAIDNIRPALQNDGGDIEFVSFDEESNIIKVKLAGACYGCPLSQMTLTHGVQRYLRETLKNPALIVVNEDEGENGSFDGWF